MHIKLDAALHAKSHHFSLLPSTSPLFVHCLLHSTSSHFIMTGRTDQISPLTGNAAAFGLKAVPSTESNAASASSSFNATTQSIVKKKVPMMFEY
jgi:hypothetical protein